MDTLNKILNGLVIGTVLAAASYFVAEGLPGIDSKYAKPEIIGVFALAGTLLIIGVREMFSIHDNLH